MISGLKTMALTWEKVEEINTNYAATVSQKRFYVIFPNGTKVPMVPLGAVIDAMVRNPSLRPMKTMGDLGVPSRLVLVVEATTPNADGSESIYWRQAFYFSTGTSSGMQNTWLPFDGIELGGAPEARVIGDDSGLGNQPAPGEMRIVTRDMWFDKIAFGSVYNSSFFASDDERYRMAQILFSDGMFLPERYAGDRMGPLSYAIASYLLGGGTWERGLNPADVRPYIRKKESDYPSLQELIALLSPPSPARAEFTELAKDPTFPFSKIAAINAYIGINKAVSYMNMFWGSGLEDTIPMPKDVEVIVNFRGAQYLIPPVFLVNRFRKGFRNILLNVYSGRMSGDTATLAAARQAVIEEAVIIRPRVGAPWNFLENLPNLVFVLAESNAQYAHALGGRHKKRKTIRRKTRKGKSRRKPLPRGSRTRISRRKV